MAVRRFQVHPDVQVPTHEYGMVPAVSRQLIDQAFLDGAALVSNAGGVFTVVAGRHPTDLPGEMLTTGLVCEWKDRTDAKPQPERAGQVTVAPPAEEEEEFSGSGAPLDYEPPPLTEEQVARMDEVVGEEHGYVASDSPDGLDPATLEEEDLDSVPEIAR